jgi:ferrous iron transport protein A
MMPISMGSVGQSYVIQRISGNSEVRAYLRSLGFNEGTDVRLISQLNGDVIVHVKDARVAINQEQARHIYV